MIISKILNEDPQNYLPIKDLDYKILINLYGYNLAYEQKTNEFIPHGLSRIQFEILAVINGFGPQTASQLAVHYKVTKANITGLISRLEGKGLVKRYDHEEDARSKIIKLTEKGHQLLDSVLPSVLKEMTKHFSVLSDDEKRSLITITRKVLKSYEDSKQESKNSPT